ncbi:MAG: efflux RND transporter periplasmic adaptor subunit [Synergistaceae bacterium]|nr:efflux RND transporter periplasmic adaptor subunit [Synergistaceae bacterium]
MRVKPTYLLFITLILFGCGFTVWKIINRPQPIRSVSVAAIRAQNGIPVSLYEINDSAWEYWLPLYGAVNAPRLSQVSANHQEYLIDIQVEVGDTVKQGQVLALLDNKTSLEKVEAARARNRELEARHNRLESLQRAGGSSAQELETAFTLLRDSQANLKQLTTDLSRMKILSPISGIIIKRDAETGQLSSPSKPLFEVADMSHIEITLDVAPNVSSLIKPGMPAKVKTEEGWANASVRRINPVANSATGLYNCVLTVNDPAMYSFKLGSMVESLVLIEKETSALSVPYETIREVSGRPVVYVASGDAAIERPIKRGRITDMKVRILDGLSAGEKLVQKGVDRAYDGAKIWIQNQDAVSADIADRNK